MLTCVLNAAEGQLNIIIGTSEGILCSQNWATSAKGPIKGAEILTPALDNVLTLSGLNASSIERWACVYGPGSFTGIRLVLGTVAAIRRITKAQNAAIDFLQALAFDAQNMCKCSPDQGEIWVLTHARRSMVHVQCFRPNVYGIPKPLGPAKLSLIQDVNNQIQKGSSGSIILGSGFERNKNEILPALQGNFKIIEHVNPTPNALWQMSFVANYHTNDIEPLYIRPCDAIENLDSIAQKQGMEPQIAHARLNELLKQNYFN